jgi:hypothetical protein
MEGNRKPPSKVPAELQYGMQEGYYWVRWKRNSGKWQPAQVFEDRVFFIGAQGAYDLNELIEWYGPVSIEGLLS